MPFARRTFFWAGIYGLVVLLPLYFMERRLGRDFPPPFNHPEHFYGFLSVAVAWQVAFLVISRDVVRLRPLMIPAVLEKLLYALTLMVLFAAGRVSLVTAAPAVVDLGLGVLFAIAYVRTAGGGAGGG